MRCVGWGFCIEESFSVLWYAIVLIALLPTASIGFAIGWWVVYSPTMFGMASAFIGLCSFGFTLWVARMKGSMV